MINCDFFFAFGGNIQIFILGQSAEIQPRQVNSATGLLPQKGLCSSWKPISRDRENIEKPSEIEVKNRASEVPSKEKGPI